MPFEFKLWRTGAIRVWPADHPEEVVDHLIAEDLLCVAVPQAACHLAVEWVDPHPAECLHKIDLPVACHQVGHQEECLPADPQAANQALVTCSVITTH